METVSPETRIRRHQLASSVRGPRAASISSATIGRTVAEDKLNFNWTSTESDNHADTHCFGANFRPIHWSDL